MTRPCIPCACAASLGLSPSEYYAWRKRGLSQRARENAALTTEVLKIHAMSGATYGAPRVHAKLRARSRTRVARLMRMAGIERVSRRRGKGKTTQQAAHSRNETSRPRAPTSSGWPTSPTCPPARASSTSRSCSTPGADGWWAGRWPRTSGRLWCWTPSTWRSRSADPMG